MQSRALATSGELRPPDDPEGPLIVVVCGVLVLLALMSSIVLAGGEIAKEVAGLARERYWQACIVLAATVAIHQAVAKVAAIPAAFRRPWQYAALALFVAAGIRVCVWAADRAGVQDLEFWGAVIVSFVELSLFFLYDITLEQAWACGRRLCRVPYATFNERVRSLETKLRGLRAFALPSVGVRLRSLTRHFEQRLK